VRREFGCSAADTGGVSDPYTDLMAQAEADPDVLGVVLTGSLAREGMASVHSDADVIVVVAEYGGAWTATTRTPRLDTIPISLAHLADVSDRWARYAYRGARVLLDRLDGRVAELVRAQATLTAAETEAWVRAELDGYVNFIYRAAKNRRDGRPDLARLDEAEAASWFGWTLFALHSRVRPYNKYLRWELDTHPLPAPWTADYVIAGLTERPSALFGDLETVVRAEGYGDVLDSWGPDLALLR
jgi:hypothetical protein